MRTLVITMDEFWELPEEIQKYIRSHNLPIQMYSSPVGEGFQGLDPKAGIVTAVIKNEDDEVLFIRHSEEGRFWELPSGHIEKDENPEEAVNREVLEETGHELKEVHPVLAIVWPFEDTVRVQIVFSATLGEEVSDTDEEAEEIKWHSNIPDKVTFGEFGHEVYEYYIDNWEEVQNEDSSDSYIKHGFAILGAALSVAALKGIQKYRSNKEE